MARRYFQMLCLSIYVVGIAIQISLSVRAADGRLIYTLDDAYIHLSVAENILHGAYGINFEEFSSPSSSIVYALLLAPLLAVGLGDAAPLLLAFLAQGGAVWLLSGVIRDYVLGEPEARIGAPLYAALALVIPLSINSFGLPLTGMEHSIHLLASILVLRGLLELGLRGAAPLWLAPAIVICALIRFEGYALALAAMAVLVWRRRYGLAAGTFLALALVTGVYVAVMRHFGLPLLPSSVMVKSGVAANSLDGDAHDALRGVLANVRDSLNDRWGTLFAVTIALAGLSLTLKTTAAARAAIVAGMVALAAHLAFGKYGWFGRYETYAVGIMVVILAASFGATLHRGTPAWSGPLATVAGMAILAAPYVQITLLTPRAARNVYEQQFQMHRFATEFFPHPVAVNDIGWVSYRNDAYVLDLDGLGSEEARRMKQTGARTSDAIEGLARRKNAVYAMIYDQAFTGVVPKSWRRMADLKTSRISSAYDDVTFYLIDAAKAVEMGEALQAFASSMPSGSSLTVSSEVRP